jgi:predicted nucleotidyltransferase
MFDVDPELHWADRLRDDRERAFLFQTPSLQMVTAEVLRRAADAGALAVALTGSTARGHRTAISDLDFHLVGTRPDLSDLPAEVDLVADSLRRFQRRLAEGDDFVQWTVRLGCVLHDPHGIFRTAYAQILREGLWPDPYRKFERAEALALLAERVLAIEDREAGQEHIRGGLTSLARGYLLAEEIFPRARDELATQLSDAGRGESARWLHRSIHEALNLDDLRAALGSLRQAARERSIRPARGAGDLPKAA